MTERPASTEPETQPDALADPIDWARHYWERYDLGDGKDGFAAMTSTMRFSRIMMDTVEGVLKPCGLNVTDYLLLMTLVLSETGSRLISRLARNLLVHPTTATLATDRLELRELLQRKPHPTDRRAILVSITDEGRALVDRASALLREANFGFDGASEEDLRRTTKLMAELRAAAGDPDLPRD